MKRLFGAIVLLMGVALAAWIFYNLFIERLPEAQGKSPVGAILLAALFIYVGVMWLRGKTAG